MINEIERKGEKLARALFHCSRDPVYWGTAGGITCRVLVSGQGLGLISMRSLHWSLHNLPSIPGSVIYCPVYTTCPVWSPGPSYPPFPLLSQPLRPSVLPLIQ